MFSNFNVTSKNLYNSYVKSTNELTTSVEKISSGRQINRASDDAAGLAISEKLLSQMNGLNVAAKNTQDGVAMIDTAEGAMEQIHSLVQTMRERAVQAANDTNTAEERSALNADFQQFMEEISRIAGQTEFNTRKLINGDYENNPLKLQIGANSGQHMDVFFGNMNWSALSKDLGDPSSMNLLTQENASSMISVMDSVLNRVSTERSKLGSYTNRLEHAYNVTMNTGENLTAAYSQITDVDLAKEAMKMTQANLKKQVSESVLSMHMQSATNVLNLLR